MTGIKPAEIEVVLEEMECNLVCPERKKVKIRKYRYRRRHKAEWLPLVADVEVRSGEPVMV